MECVSSLLFSTSFLIHTTSHYHVDRNLTSETLSSHAPKGKRLIPSPSLLETDSVPDLMEELEIRAPGRVLGLKAPWDCFRQWAVRKSSSYPFCPNFIQPAGILNRSNNYPTYSWRIKLWNVMLNFYDLPVFVMHRDLPRTWFDNLTTSTSECDLIWKLGFKIESSGWVLIQQEIWTGSKPWEEMRQESHLWKTIRATLLQTEKCRRLLAEQEEAAFLRRAL